MRAAASPDSTTPQVLRADAAMAAVVLLLGLFLAGTGGSMVQRLTSSSARRQSLGFEDQLGLVANTAGLIVTVWWAMSLVIAITAALLERSGKVRAASAAGKFAPDSCAASPWPPSDSSCLPHRSPRHPPLSRYPQGRHYPQCRRHPPCSRRGQPPHPLAVRRMDTDAGSGRDWRSARRAGRCPSAVAAAPRSSNLAGWRAGRGAFSSPPAGELR
ncbi:hypothetical protein PJ267_20910 [Arthrobacter sp. OVS8]|nr:hypothetical protein PJ267_20910 [Arthrobacter sp. OVS8]